MYFPPALRAFLVFAIASIPSAASAFWIQVDPYPEPIRKVEEYFSLRLGHYFYALEGSDEAMAIAFQGDRSDWGKTGLSFGAYTSIEATNPYQYLRPNCDLAADPCVAVSRFYAPSANSYFFTGYPAETEILRQPGTGWVYEKTAFVVPIPNGAGQCGPGLVPVYRLYNNRWRENDSNHRFTASRDARERVLAAGWRDEGTAFCAYGAAAISKLTLDLRSPRDPGVQSWEECNAPTATGICMGVFNLQVPTVSWASGPWLDEFSERTGTRLVGPNSGIAILGLSAASRAAAAANFFVQYLHDGTVGTHLATISRGTSPWSSLVLQRSLGANERFFPWRSPSRTSYDLSLKFGMHLERVEIAPGSHAYGNTLIEFVDSKSGRALRFNVLAFGTLSGGDFVGSDARDAVTIVGTTFREASAFGRSVYRSARLVSAPYRYGGGDPLDLFEYRIMPSEFAAILTAARTVDPTLSSEPEDYYVRRYGVNQEIYGEGEIGSLVDVGAALSLLPR